MVHASFIWNVKKAFNLRFTLVSCYIRHQIFFVLHLLYTRAQAIYLAVAVIYLFFSVSGWKFKEKRRKRRQAWNVEWVLFSKITKYAVHVGKFILIKPTSWSFTTCLVLLDFFPQKVQVINKYIRIYLIIITYWMHISPHHVRWKEVKEDRFIIIDILFAEERLEV